MVMKSEKNGAHDGRIVQGPCDPVDGYVYQRVIDNRIDRGLVEDLRCPTIGGRIPLVLPKRRRVEDRFLNSNDEVLIRETDEVLSRSEQDMLAKFTRAMGLDWVAWTFCATAAMAAFTWSTSTRRTWGHLSQCHLMIKSA